MSIIVAVHKKNEIVIAADSQSNFGSYKVPQDNHSAAKIRKVGSAYLATTGWGLYENIFDDFLDRKKIPPLGDRKAIFSFFLLLWQELHEHYPFVNDQAGDEEDQKSPFGNLDAAFLVANEHGIFSISSDMSITHFNKYYAMGSGADFSLGAIHVLYDSELSAEELARRAVETAIAFSSDCGGEVDVRKVAMKK